MGFPLDFKKLGPAPSSGPRPAQWHPTTEEHRNILGIFGSIFLLHDQTEPPPPTNVMEYMSIPERALHRITRQFVPQA